jgi:hypothetical protein
MAAYVEQLSGSEKRSELIGGSLQILRLLLSGDQTHRREVTRFAAVSFGILSWGMFHHHLLPTCDLSPGQRV